MATFRYIEIPQSDIGKLFTQTKELSGSIEDLKAEFEMTRAMSGGYLHPTLWLSEWTHTCPFCSAEVFDHRVEILSGEKTLISRCQNCHEKLIIPSPEEF